MIAAIEIFVKGKEILKYKIKTIYYQSPDKHKSKIELIDAPIISTLLFFENLFNS